MRKGFTLIEVMIVLSILAILFAVIALAISGGSSEPNENSYKPYTVGSYYDTEENKEIITVNGKRYQLID
jgi:prepilin-type N-terminal cleavage/methylation domain-containing protein